MMPRLDPRLPLVCCFLIFAVSSIQGQVVERRPTPSWLQGAARYELSFELRDPLLMAILLVAAEREVTALVNDEPVGSGGDPSRASGLDVTGYLRSGMNTIALVAKDGAPVRAAALLELKGEVSASHWIATGSAWTAPSGGITVEEPSKGDPATNPFDPGKTVDAYSSWKLAQRDQQSEATDPAGFTLPAGFKAELIRSAQADEDSWVSMAFDPKGRLTVAREKRGLLRFDPAGGTELIDDTLLECRGLLYTDGALFVHANNSKVLVRLRDVNGDGSFEERQELLRTEGGVGHGRNHLKLGPDGYLWIAYGNNVKLPDGVSPHSPLRHFAADQVLPNPWDSSMFDGDVEPPAGHILRMNLAGDDIELFAGGLRNPVDIAFNRAGELFTFDADMEWDIRAPWYMPNRVLHLVSGGDYGWRRGTGRFPAWSADTLPSVADVGLGSPTAVFFGYGGKMPGRYREALFICDWAYGRILALPLRPDGATYAGEPEPFISGRPLNVTDGCIGPDGALWFITGGRGTQSGLYRVSYEGAIDAAPAEESDPSLRDLRHQLEAYHRGIAVQERGRALEFIVPQLDHHDRFIRFAARVALEQIPPGLWQQQLLEKPDGWSVILGCLALARVAEAEITPLIIDRLVEIPWETIDEQRSLAILRVLGVTLARRGDADDARRGRLLASLEPRYPAADFPMNQELCRLLIRLKSPAVLAKTLPLLRAAKTAEELVFYPLHLRYLESGWEVEAHRAVFEALNRAEEFDGGGRNFTKAIQDLRAEFVALLSPAEAGQLAGVLRSPVALASAPVMPEAVTVREWKLEELVPQLDQVGRGRSFVQGRATVTSTGCVACHRLSPDPALPASVFGPDLVQVSARFGRRDLLDHILNPSKVVEEKYRMVTLTRSDGTRITGTLEREDDESIILKPDPLGPGTVGVGKSQIVKREVSVLSSMPAGLLNSLNEAQILDLLAFLEAGGDPEHRNFQP